MQPNSLCVIPHLRKMGVVRTFAAAAAKKPQEAAPTASSSSSFENSGYHIPREELKVTKVANNVTVASVETNKPLAKLAVFIRAGSRFETDKTQGVSQMLRICAGLGTEHFSHFGTVRNLEQNGSGLTCTTGREYIAYTLDASRDKLHNVDKFLKELSSFQVFKPWEVSDNVPRVKIERTIRPPEARIMELIHKAAFRKGLGYSLYSPKWMIGNHSSEMLHNFVKTNFTEATVVGVGIDHEQLKVYGAKIQLHNSGRKIQPSKFYPGSELRKETNTGLAYVALAIEGASYNDYKKMATAALVQRALGSGPRTKRGMNLGGKVAAAVGGEMDELSTKAAATTFNASYSDSGITGVFIAATPCSVETVTKKAAEILQSANFSDADLARAKAQLKSDIAFATESEGGLVEEVGLQSLLTGNVFPPKEIEGLVDSVTTSDMNALVTGSNLVMASFGSIANVPYLDSLRK